MLKCEEGLNNARKVCYLPHRFCFTISVEIGVVFEETTDIVTRKKSALNTCQFRPESFSQELY